MYISRIFNDSRHWNWFCPRIELAEFEQYKNQSHLQRLTWDETLEYRVCDSILCSSCYCTCTLGQLTARSMIISFSWDWHACRPILCWYICFNTACVNEESKVLSKVGAKLLCERVACHLLSQSAHIKCLSGWISGEALRQDKLHIQVQWMVSIYHNFICHRTMTISVWMAHMRESWLNNWKAMLEMLKLLRSSSIDSETYA